VLADSLSAKQQAISLRHKPSGAQLKTEGVAGSR